MKSALLILFAWCSTALAQGGGASSEFYTGDFGTGRAKSEVKVQQEPSTASTALQLPIKYARLTNASDPDYNGAYWRIRVSMGEPSEVLAAPDQSSVASILLTKIKNAIWQRDEELLVLLRPVIDQVPAGPPTLVVHLKSDGTPDVSSALQDKALSQVYLTYARPVPNAVDVQVIVIRVHKNETKLLASIAGLVDLIAPVNALFKTGLPLSASKVTDLKQNGDKVDSLLSELASSSKTYGPIALKFNPLPDAGGATSRTWVEELYVYSGDRDSRTNRLFTIENKRVESLIGANFELKRIPDDSSDIKRTQFVTKGSTGTLADALRIDADELYTLIASEKIQEFCRRAHTVLGDKLGLQRPDRVAVVWAYVVQSSWAGRGGSRPASDADDNCVEALRGAGTGSLSQLRVPPNPREEADRSRLEVWESSSPYRQSAEKKGGLIPQAILKTGDAKGWTAIFADSVRLTAVRRKIKVGEKLLDPGDSTTKTGTQAAELLSAMPLTWVESKPGEAPCFRRADEQTTRRAFLAAGRCMQLKAAQDTVDLPTEFVVEQLNAGDKSLPKVVEVRFFAD